MGPMLADKEYERIKHVGVEPGRAKGGTCEKLYVDEWVRMNERRPGLNSGAGYTELLLTPGRLLGRGVLDITQRDATVAATIVQWLGTSCGAAMLQTVEMASARLKSATRPYVCGASCTSRFVQLDMFAGGPMIDMRCSRCSGGVEIQRRDDDAYEYVCLQCGARRPVDAKDVTVRTVKMERGIFSDTLRQELTDE